MAEIETNPKRCYYSAELTSCELGRLIWAISMNVIPAADQVFILRFWRETTGCGGEARWRVQVRHVNTRQRQIADDVKTAFALVLAQLNNSCPTEENVDRNFEAR